MSIIITNLFLIVKINLFVSLMHSFKNQRSPVFILLPYLYTRVRARKKEPLELPKGSLIISTFFLCQSRKQRLDDGFAKTIQTACKGIELEEAREIKPAVM